MEILQFVQSDRIVSSSEQRYSAGQFFTTIRHIIHTVRLTRKPAPIAYSKASTNTSQLRSWRSSSQGPRTSTIARLNQLNSVHTEQFDLLNLHPVLELIDYPDDELYAVNLLHQGINQVSADANSYKAFPCAVCGGAGHSFQDCPYLQNTPKVKEAYGELRAYLNRCCNVAAKLNKSLGELQQTPVQQLQVHALVATPAPSYAHLSTHPHGDVSALTTPTAVKSVSIANTLPTTMMHDDASTDGSSCGNSLDFR